MNADETPLRTMARKLFIPETNAKNMVIKESKQDPFDIKHDMTSDKYKEALGSSFCSVGDKQWAQLPGKRTVTRSEPSA